MAADRLPDEVFAKTSLLVDTEDLMNIETPTQKYVDGVLAAQIGLGSDASQNSALRSALNKPGNPYGGIGFFEWTDELEHAVPDAGSSDALSPLVMDLKLQEFEHCANGEPSMYYWVLHPIFNSNDHAVGAEVLVRAKNGMNTAPFDDVHALMDPAAPPKIQNMYTKWKSAEILDWPMQALIKHPVLRRLTFISVNVRPLDLCTNSQVFKEVRNRMSELKDEDRQLLVSTVSIEVCEDQEDPPNIEILLAEWQKLGFRLAYDDTVSELTCQALGKPSGNFHTTQTLQPLLKYFWLVKVDIDWAGLLFLCHPSLGQGDRKAEVVSRVREEGLVYVAQGDSSLRNTGVKHADVLAEFAAWARQIILLEKKICFELTVKRDDPNCVVAIEGLRQFDIDIFGKHSAHFCFQGGICGPKAFEPSQLARAMH